MTIGQYFENQLSGAFNKAVEEVFPDRMIMNGFSSQIRANNEVPTISLLKFNTSIPAWRNEYEYPVYTSQGIAEFYTHASDDIPLVSMGKEMLYGRLKEIVIGDEWTTREIEQDQALNGNMMMRSMMAIKRGTDIKLEDIYYLGSTEHRIFGLLNFPGVTQNTLPNDGAGALTTFGSKTAAQNYRDLVTMCLAVSSRSKNAFHADTLLLPQSVYNQVSTTILTGATTTSDTVLEIIRRNMASNPFGIKNIVPVPYLDGRGTGGTGLAIAYNSKSDNQEAILCDYLRRYGNSDSTSNDAVNYKYSVNYHSVTGGTVVYNPLSMVRFDAV